MLAFALKGKLATVLMVTTVPGTPEVGMNETCGGAVTVNVVVLVVVVAQTTLTVWGASERKDDITWV